MIGKILKTTLVMACMIAVFSLVAFIECVNTFSAIKPGMTRIEVMRLFPQDGGISTPSSALFLHSGARYIKVHVKFFCKRDLEGRAIFSPNDRVESISLPYFQNQIFD
jgi:hypothetical protein